MTFLSLFVFSQITFIRSTFFLQCVACIDLIICHTLCKILREYTHMGSPTKILIGGVQNSIDAPIFLHAQALLTQYYILPLD